MVECLEHPVGFDLLCISLTAIITFHIVNILTRRLDLQGDSVDLGWTLRISCLGALTRANKPFV